MISASALLVVIAFVTLIVGIFQSGLGLIWVSIAASVLAAVFLGLGVVGGRRPLAAGGEGPVTGVLEPAERALTLDERIAMPAEAAPEAVEAPATPARPAASRARAARPAAGEVTVVVVPGRDKYHKETCRYAKGAGAMTLTKNQARRDGYKRCGVCKP